MGGDRAFSFRRSDARAPDGLVTGRESANAAAFDAFRSGVADILISTDVGAEGLNLQRAGVVVHYDLPWNPARIEQRNGRAHRIGQRRDVVRAIFFLPDRSRGAVLRTVARKKRARRQILRPSAAVLLLRCETLRPRIAADAGIVAVAKALRDRGLAVPPLMLRRHRAGVEALLRVVGSKPLDDRSLHLLEATLSEEPSLEGLVRFGPL